LWGWLLVALWEPVVNFYNAPLFAPLAPPLFGRESYDHLLLSRNILHELFNHAPKVGGMAYWVKEVSVINSDIGAYFLESDFYMSVQSDNRGQPFHFEVVLPP
jgi:hypothetical protein